MPAGGLLTAGLISGGAQVIGGIFKGIAGGKQKREGRRILRENPAPEYTIPGEITQAAAEGLPSQQYEQAMKNIQRQQSTAIARAQERRGGLASIGKIQDNTNNATLGLDVADAQARQQNQRVLAQYRDKAWDWNKRQKFERAYSYGQNLLGAGNQNVAAGFDQAVAGIGMGANTILGNRTGGGANNTSVAGGGNYIGDYPMYGANQNYDYFQTKD